MGERDQRSLAWTRGSATLQLPEVGPWPLVTVAAGDVQVTTFRTLWTQPCARASATLWAPEPGRVAPMTVCAGSFQSSTRCLLRWAFGPPAPAVGLMRGSATVSVPGPPMTVRAGPSQDVTPCLPLNHIDSSPGISPGTASRGSATAPAPLEGAGDRVTVPAGASHGVTR